MAEDITNKTPEEALKPVGGFKTKIAKLASGTGLAIAAATIAAGVAYLVIGHKALKSNIQTPATQKILRDIGVFAKQIGKSPETAVNIAGASTIALGIVGAGAADAAYSSAGGATRARNYVKLSEQLNTQERSLA